MCQALNLNARKKACGIMLSFLQGFKPAYDFEEKCIEFSQKMVYL